MCICVPAKEGQTQDTAMHKSDGSNGGFTYFLAIKIRSGHRERGAKRKGGGAGERRGELSDVDRGLVVRGVGGSTGCPECTEVSRGRCKRGKEWQRMFVFR